MDIKVAALIWAEMVSAGIVPLTEDMIQSSKQAQIEKLMDTLSEDDRRVLKRKFRKLWRKESRKRKRRWGGRLKEGEPTASQMRRRKNAVWSKFYMDAMAIVKKTDPMYDVVPY